MGLVGKVNNDILIPRSILKKSEYPKKLNNDYEVDYLNEFENLINGNEQLLPKEAVVGKHVDLNGSILSPKVFGQNYLEN